MKFSRLILIALLALSASPIATGQTFGEITGRVSDPSGAAVPAANISLTNLATNAIRTTVSTDLRRLHIPFGRAGLLQRQNRTQRL